MNEQVDAGAEPAGEVASPVSRIRAFLTPQEPKAEANEQVEGDEKPEKREQVARAQVESATREDADEPEAEEEETDAEVEETDEGDAEQEDVQLSTFAELADATGLELDKLMDLSLPTKIDGKEGTARVRDLLKSYQLDGHINQKLATLDTDRKTFEAKKAEVEKLALERLTMLDRGIGVLERSLMGEFNGVDWEGLKKSDPAQFNAQYVNYQQRFAQMQELAKQIEAERQASQAERNAQAKAWAEEQRALLKAKAPEWNDDTRRAQDRASMLEYLKGYGVTAEEFDQVEDHRYQLIVRDAMKWAELQKQKPATLKKVKAAPKLLKPGTKQSRESRELLARKEGQAKLRRTGKVNDAVSVFKNILGTAR